MAKKRPEPVPEPVIPAVERLTVGLIPDAARAIERVQQRTGLKKVDVVNRAVVVYDYIDEQVRAGSELLIRDELGELHRVRII